MYGPYLPNAADGARTWEYPSSLKIFDSLYGDEVYLSLKWAPKYVRIQSNTLSLGSIRYTPFFGYGLRYRDHNCLGQRHSNLTRLFHRLDDHDTHTLGKYHDNHASRQVLQEGKAFLFDFLISSTKFHVQYHNSHPKYIIFL